MASIGHIAVGMAAARASRDRAAMPQANPPGWRSMVAWSALSLLPDAEVIGFGLGVRYASPYGLFVSSIELVLFAPFFVYALARR